MTSNTPVLPNFLKTVLFAAAASMSLSALAGPTDTGESALGDLKDMGTEAENTLETTQDELKAMLAAEEDAVAEQAEEDALLENTQDALTPEAAIEAE